VSITHVAHMLQVSHGMTIICIYNPHGTSV